MNYSLEIGQMTHLHYVVKQSSRLLASKPMRFEKPQQVCKVRHSAILIF